MATATYPLKVLAAAPDPSNPPGLGFTTTDNEPYLIFDGGSTTESVRWSLRMPDDWDGTTAPTLTVQWSNSTTNTNNVVWQCQVHAITPNSDTDDGTAARTYDTTNKSAADAGVGTRQVQEVSITLTNRDSMAAGDLVSLRFFRDPSDASDTMGEDAHVYTEVTLKYETA